MNEKRHVSACFLSSCEQTFDAKLLHIESRPGRNSKNGTTDLEFFMRCDVHGSDVDVFIDSLKSLVEDVRSVPEEKGEGPPASCVADSCKFKDFNGNSLPVHVTGPWFPRQLKDLDRCNMLITKFDPDLDQGHPVSTKDMKTLSISMQNDTLGWFLKGYRDPEYRKRRAFIAELASRYKQ